MDRRKSLKTMVIGSLGAFNYPFFIHPSKRDKNSDFIASYENDLLEKAKENIQKYRTGNIVLSLTHKVC
jgi:hypothetical protein